MAIWPSNPSWIDPTTINDGNQYDAADGVTAEDINKIINDLIYLRDNGGPQPSGTITITQNGTYVVLNYANAVVAVPQPTGTRSITRNGTYNVFNYEYASVNVPSVIIDDGLIHVIEGEMHNYVANPVFPLNANIE